MKSIGCLNSVETFVASEFLIKERNAVHFMILIIQSNKWMQTFIKFCLLEKILPSQKQFTSNPKSNISRLLIIHI